MTLAFFIDEFGHEEPFQSKRGQSWKYNPVFGYGGIVLPGKQVDAFATHFFDIKTYALRNVLVNRQVDPVHRDGTPDRRFQIQERLKNLAHSEVVSDKEVRRLCSKYEVKGSEIFSRTYLNKLNNVIAAPKSGGDRSAAIAKRQGFFNFARRFLRLLEQYDAEVIYFGVDKARYLPQDFRSPHVKFVPEIVRLGFSLAKSRNTTATLFLDRHHSDGAENNFGERHQKGRIATARRVILDGAMVEHITEPVFPVRSHESQCIQAADWICYMFSQTFPFLCDETRWAKYGAFYRKLSPMLFHRVAPVSEFHTGTRSLYGNGKQPRFAFIETMPTDTLGGLGRRRPYHRRDDAPMPGS